ncbi:MAG: hypothetical protein JNK82_12960 [Myxococcaceae bacterium]|nr:hypothetical protein [Myxococcaceae bacterium]
MVAALALALVVSAAGPTAASSQVPQLLLAKKKKKKPKAAPRAKEKEAPAAETNEGLDLTQPDPAPAAETSSPAASEPVENVAAEAGEKTATDDDDWSIVTPETIGAGANVIEAGAGWPGIYAGYWRGILSELDVGAKVGFNWSYEGFLPAIVPGLRIQAQARYEVFDNDTISIGVSFAPGALIYFFRSGVRPGVILPVAATVGLPNFVEKLNLSATLELPFFVAATWGLPILVGANGEYAITESLLVLAKVRAGPAITPAGASFALDAVVGAAYKL